MLSYYKYCSRVISDHFASFFILLSAISCASLLGRIGDKQVLSLQRYGCVRKGIIQHELLHALGFYHEHTRSDRDMYVRINWENVNKCKNFTSSPVHITGFFLFVFWLLATYWSFSCQQIMSSTSKRWTQITWTLLMTTPLWCTMEGNAAQKCWTKANKAMLNWILLYKHVWMTVSWPLSKPIEMPLESWELKP